MSSVAPQEAQQGAAPSVRGGPSSALRHGEAAIATLTWLAALPVMLYLTNHRVLMTVLAVLFIVGLTLHSCSVSYFIQESGEEDHDDTRDDNGLFHSSHAREDMQADVGPVKAATSIERTEECKFIFTFLIILSAVGCTVALSTGGALVFHVFTTGTTTDCNIADLADFQHHGRTAFHCNDGHVDLGKQLSVMKRQGMAKDSYSIYHMAPVYSGAHSVDKVPLALAVSTNDHLDDEPCDSGLCGILVSTKGLDVCTGLSCATDTDKTAYAELRHAMGRSLGDHSAFDDDAIPIIELSPPTNPNGKFRHFVLGASFYLFTLGGLIGIQVAYAREAQSRPPDANAPETRYEVLQGPQ